LIVSVIKAIGIMKMIDIKILETDEFGSIKSKAPSPLIRNARSIAKNLLSDAFIFIVVF
jgi:hypothetical protein